MTKPFGMVVPILVLALMGMPVSCKKAAKKDSQISSDDQSAEQIKNAECDQKPSQLQAYMRGQIIQGFTQLGERLRENRVEAIAAYNKGKNPPGLRLETVRFKQRIKYSDNMIGVFKEIDPNPSVPENAWRGRRADAKAGQADSIDPVMETREADILIPNSPAGEKPRIMMVLHGYMTDNVTQSYYFGFHKALNDNGQLISLAEELNAIIVMPNGLRDRPDDTGSRFWSTGKDEPCCNLWQVTGGQPYLVDASSPAPVGTEQQDLTMDYDIKYIEALANYVQSHYENSGEFHLVGHSNGAFLAHQLACRSNLDIRSVIALAGVIPNDITSCRKDARKTPLSVVQIHGTKDSVINYEGSTCFGVGQTHKSAKDSYDYYASKICPDANPMTATFSVRRFRNTDAVYKECGQQRVGLWTIREGGHIPVLFGSLDEDANVYPENSMMFRSLAFVLGAKFFKSEQ